MTDSLRLAELRLHNWKAYPRARIVLPEQGRVVVIGGENGAGKTSLLEALAMGLYGREGLGLIARAKDRRRGETSYDGFLERALNREGRGADAMMSVEAVFTHSGRGRLAIERVWYFSSSGKHERDDEDVRLRAGEDEDLVPTPQEGRDAFIRDYVANNFLPVNLAPFFIFDGEHVDRLAGQDLEGQVRSAVEAMLGVPVIRETVQDLRTFARERRRESREADGSALGALKDTVAAFEAREDVFEAAVEGTNAELAPLRSARDDLVTRIGALHGDSYASFKGLFEGREARLRDRVEQQEALRRALSVDLAFALTGDGLRRAVQKRLAAEALRDQWQAGLQTSEARYDAFISLLGDDLPSSEVQARVRAAWDIVWNQPPVGAATDLRHGHLGEAERHLVSRHLAEVSDAAGARIGELTREVQATDAKVLGIEAQIARQRGIDGQSQALADDLRQVQERIATLEAKHRLDVQALDELRAELAPRKQELSRLIEQHATAAPILRRADRAESYAGVLEDLMEASVPGHMVSLSTLVTEAYRSMAHKGEVAEVQISETGDVRLLDVHGEDLRNRDASAGETHVFALSLMAAVAASATGFPMIMDTPFARLDPRHRHNVLQHFAQLGGQLILLAHPAELAQTDLAELGDDLAASIEVVHDAAGATRYSRAQPRRGADHGA